MNLGQIQLACYDRLGFNSTPDPAVIRRVNQYINFSQREVLSKRGYGALRRSILPVTSVASSPFMVMPQALTAILVIADRANNLTLDCISIQDTRYRDPGQVFTGAIPDSYTVLNFSAAVALDPTVPDSLYVVSDSAVDGPGMAVNIEGVITGGYYRRVAVSLNGLTAVNVSAAIANWAHVTKFYLSAGAAGNVTLHQTSGVGPEMARITPGRTSTRYTQVQLSGIPAQSQTYYVDAELHVEDMVNANDEPLLPEDFHWMMECGVMKREFLKRKDMQLWSIENSNWKEGLRDLSVFLRRQGKVGTAGQRGSQSRREGSQFSSPWFNG